MVLGAHYFQVLDLGQVGWPFLLPVGCKGILLTQTHLDQCSEKEERRQMDSPWPMVLDGYRPPTLHRCVVDMRLLSVTSFVSFLKLPVLEDGKNQSCFE